MIDTNPQLLPAPLRGVLGRARARRSDPLQLREFHAGFSPRGRLEGPRRESRMEAAPVGPAPPLPLVTLAEAFSGQTPPPEVLVFGDSTSLLVSRFDVWRQPLLEMLVDRIRPLRTCVVAHIGWHGAVQAALLRAVATMPCQPRVVFLPISLRQTCPQWAANPYFQFEGLINAAAALASDPAGPIPVAPPHPRGPVIEAGPDIDPVQWERFRSAPLDMSRLGVSAAGPRTVGEAIDLFATKPDGGAALQARMRAVFAYHWAPGQDMQRLVELGEALKIAEGFGARVVGQMTPANYQAGRELLGSDFDRLFSDYVSMTAKFCTDAVADPGNLLLEDLTQLLPAKEFFYPTDPTEHFGEVGRAAVARRMARLVKQAAG